MTRVISFRKTKVLPRGAWDERAKERTVEELVDSLLIPYRAVRAPDNPHEVSSP